MRARLASGAADRVVAPARAQAAPRARLFSRFALCATKYLSIGRQRPVESGSPVEET
jgi:hypothetical protein